MSDKKLKLEWVCDGRGGAQATLEELVLLAKECAESWFYASALWDGQTVWKASEPERKLEAAQIAAENAARDPCEKFRQLSGVLGSKETKE